MVDIFFREIRSRGSYRIPRRGAVIFVAAPHANQVITRKRARLMQFIDPLILMREARREAGRRISFLIAESSMRRKFVGAVARAIAASTCSCLQRLIYSSRYASSGSYKARSGDDQPAG